MEIICRYAWNHTEIQINDDNMQKVQVLLAENSLKVKIIPFYQQLFPVLNSNNP